ncbi:MAG TPA: NADH-quinone oxidoreductase subunit N [Longimicrobium sp.]
MDSTLRLVTHQADYLWALLPEIVLTLGAMAVLLGDVLQKGNASRPSARWVPWASLAVLALTFVANIPLVTQTIGANPAEVLRDVENGMVAVDAFRGLTNCLFILSGVMTILISIGYLDRRGINRGEFYALVLFAVLGMMLMAGASDLMMVFIGLEVMSVAIYVLVGFDRMDPRSTEGSLKYFLLGAFSSAFFLYGIALTFGATGTTNIRVLQSLLIGGANQSTMLLAGMGLLLVGFGFKVAAIPFHMWTPDAYDGAPTPVTALMATGVKAAAFAALIRLFLVAFSANYADWARPVYLLAAVTMIVGNLVALTQGSLKRMLAYSSIAHAGYLLAAVVTGVDGVGAFLFYLLVYTLMTAGAFGIVIANARGTEERVTLEDYAGLASQKPWLALMMSIFLLSLAGFPLTAGFLGKLYILRSLVGAQLPDLAVILVLTSLVSYFYYLRVIVVMYMRPAASAGEHREARLTTPAFVGVGFAAAALVLLFFIAGVKGGVMGWVQVGQHGLGNWAAQGLQIQPATPAGTEAPVQAQR